MVDAEPAAAPEVKEPEKKSAGLVGQHLELSPVGSLVPLVSRPVFYQMLASAGGALRVGRSSRSASPPPRGSASAAPSPRWKRPPARRSKPPGNAPPRRMSPVISPPPGWPSNSGSARCGTSRRRRSPWRKSAPASPKTRRSPAFSARRISHEYSRQSSGEVLPQWRALLDEAMASLTPSAR